MSNDLLTQLSEYGSQTRDAREPVGLAEVQALAKPVVPSLMASRPPQPSRWRMAWVAVAAAVVVLLIMAIPALLSSPESELASSTPDEAAKARAITAAEAWITAINNADVEAAYALRSPLAPDIEGGVIPYEYEDVMISTASGSTFRLQGCEVPLIDESLMFVAVVDCWLEFTDPVYVATDGGTLTWRILVDRDGLVKALLPWTGGNFSEATRAFVEYAELHRLDDYDDVCSPLVYPTDAINAVGGGFGSFGHLFVSEYVAFFPACRQLYVQLQDEIAEWVLAGKPQP